jgi:hypothetical protein
MDELSPEEVLLPSFFSVSLLIMIPSLLHTHLSPPAEVCDSPEQAAQYHFISHSSPGWIQSKEIRSLTHETYRSYVTTDGQSAVQSGVKPPSGAQD